jgi:hypothetical protein
MSLSDVIRWRDWHRSRVTLYAPLSDMACFHRKATLALNLRIASMQTPKRHQSPETFDWAAFCEAYRPDNER